MFWINGDYLNEIFLARSKRGAKWAQEHDKPQPPPRLTELASRWGYIDPLETQRSEIQRSLGAVRFGPTRQDGYSTLNDGFGFRPGIYAPPPPPPRSTPRTGPGTSTGHLPDATNKQQNEKEQQEEQNRFSEQREFYLLQQDFLNHIDAWISLVQSEAWGWYQEELDAKKNEAKEQANLALEVDFSALRGRGPEFVLEFTAIVVIIFSSVILGVLGILGKEQIGTLLAAIAGYVLGKSVSRSRSGQTEEQTSVRPGQLEVSVTTPNMGTETKNPDATIPAGGHGG